MSRLLIFGSILLLFFLDFWIYLYKYFSKDLKTTRVVDDGYNYSLIFAYLIVDFFLFSIAFLMIRHISIKSLFTMDTTLESFLIISSLWFCCSMLTDKFNTKFSNNFWHFISPQIKTVILIGLGLTFFRLIFGFYIVPNIQLIILLFLYLSMEITIVALYYLVCRISGKVEDIVDAEDIYRETESGGRELDSNKYVLDSLTEYVNTKSENNTISNLQEFINFIATIPKLKSLKNEETVTYDTEHLFNIEELRNHSLQLIINLHQVNDFPTINKYFINVYKKLVPGGYFVSKVSTIGTHKKRFFIRYPKYMGYFFYGFHFLFNRIFPFVPVFDKVFNLLSGGKRNAIAKAEVLGRLYYCGFQVVSTHVIGDHLYFVSRKTSIPALREIPSTNLIIKLKRVGMNGKIFSLYKMRTMYPYSEYLQEYIYNLNRLQEGGKILDDFRITGWGKVLRKLWIDELPQIVNYLKGDIGIVGARALSQHYFSLYPPDMRRLRIQYKNGLIPPFYADMPKTFDEIVESERRYFHQKRKQPVYTDIVYFSKAFQNIVIKKARSM
jgi:hypothetical protein